MRVHELRSMPLRSVSTARKCGLFQSHEIIVCSVVFREHDDDVTLANAPAVVGKLSELTVRMRCTSPIARGSRCDSIQTARLDALTVQRQNSEMNTIFTESSRIARRIISVLRYSTVMRIQTPLRSLLLPLAVLFGALTLVGCASLDSNSTPARQSTTIKSAQTRASNSMSAIDSSSTLKHSYDKEGTGYEYPYPVEYFEFESQRSSVRMAYLDVPPEGESRGQTVVLLHGKNFGAFAWASTIASLSQAGYRVIAPDQIGFAKSSKPAAYQYSFEQLAANTRALLASLDIDHSVIVGHSMGGMLATRYALLYPEATTKLLLVNPIGLEDYGALLPARTPDQWYAGELKQTPEGIREYQRKFYYDGVWKPEYEALTELAAGMTQHPDYPTVAWTSALIYDMIVTQPVVHDFDRLRVPVLLVIGMRDKTAVGRPFAKPDVQETMGDYTQLGKVTQKSIQGSELIELPGIGHCPQIEAFPQWNEALLNFLK